MCVVCASTVGTAVGGTLQYTGEMFVKVKIINNFYNPLDEFISIGTKNGCVFNYIKQTAPRPVDDNVYPMKRNNDIQAYGLKLICLYTYIIYACTRII